MEQTKDSWHHGKDPWSERDRVIQGYVDRAKRGETIPDKMSLPNGNVIHDFKDVVMKQIRDEIGDKETTIDWTKVDERCSSPPPESQTDHGITQFPEYCPQKHRRRRKITIITKWIPGRRRRRRRRRRTWRESDRSGLGRQKQG